MRDAAGSAFTRLPVARLHQVFERLAHVSGLVYYV